LVEVDLRWCLPMAVTSARHPWRKCIAGLVLSNPLSISIELIQKLCTPRFVLYAVSL
jgi:hypothetical protein